MIAGFMTWGVHGNPTLGTGTLERKAIDNNILITDNNTIHLIQHMIVIH